MMFAFKKSDIWYNFAPDFFCKFKDILLNEMLQKLYEIKEIEPLGETDKALAK
jgi:hypothetical protein